MALLLTDADAKRRRSSAQGSQAAGASGSWCASYPQQGLNDNCSYSSLDQCYYGNVDRVSAPTRRGSLTRGQDLPLAPAARGAMTN
jgi:hypothetical protein